VSANYSVPLSSGDVLALYGVESSSDVAAVGTLNVVGRGTVLGARYIRMLPGSETLFHSASFGVDYKDFDQSVELLDSGGFSTPITYLPFALGWDATWTEEARTSKLGLAVNFHLQGLVGDEQEFADKRFKGRPSYVYLRGNATQQWRLPQDYGLNARASWQLSGQPLISNEQFAIGGVDTVRGYPESAALGDSGLALSLEARTPSLLAGFPALADSVTDLHALAFFDAASVRVIDPISATDSFTLSGAGLGLGLKGWHGLDLSLVWAYPFKDVGNTRRGDQRLHFNLAFGW
jgi:hemolysin activation/secretion protein